jgi:hypothetical protein
MQRFIHTSEYVHPDVLLLKRLLHAGYVRVLTVQCAAAVINACFWLVPSGK